MHVEAAIAKNPLKGDDYNTRKMTITVDLNGNLDNGSVREDGPELIMRLNRAVKGGIFDGEGNTITNKTFDASAYNHEDTFDFAEFMRFIAEKCHADNFDGITFKNCNFSKFI